MPYQSQIHVSEVWFQRSPVFLVPVLSPPFGCPVSLVIALKSNTHQTRLSQCRYPSLLHPCSREGKFLLETAFTCQSKLRGEVLHLQAKPRKYLPGFPPNLKNSWVSTISFGHWSPNFHLSYFFQVPLPVTCFHFVWTYISYLASHCDKNPSKKRFKGERVDSG